MARPVWFDLRLHSGQWRFLGLPESSGPRVRLGVCGRRWGKTVAGVAWLLGWAPHGVLRRSRVRAAWFAPTYRMTKPIFEMLRVATWDLIDRIDTNLMEIQYKNGSTVSFFTNENAMTARGRGYHRFVCDEAAHMRDLGVVWREIVAPALLDTRGDAMFISTPNGYNDFYSLYEYGKRNGWLVYRAPTWENPNIDRASIEELRSWMAPLEFAQEIEAEFVAATGGYIEDGDLKYAEDDWVCEGYAIGVDLASSTRQSADYTAVCVVGTSEGRYIVEECHLIRSEAVGIAHLILETYRKWRERGPVMMAIESVQGQNLFYQIVRERLPSVVAAVPKVGKELRFLPIQGLYKRGAVYHRPHLRDSEFEKQLLQFPHGKHDDAVDALVYALTILAERPIDVRELVAFI